MKKHVFVSNITVIAISLFIVSCSKSGGGNTIPPPPPPPSACSGTAGPLYTAVKTLMAANCQSCHNNTIANGGMNWTVDCNIVINKTRIKARAVDEGTMPPTGSLPQADKNKITDWINAGGKFTD